ncbi:MAG TPA: biotin--[acetyl-CoA-carboxylase] ligase [Bacteroidota bacterium]|nr:biotin--[acetyl-CoA-carboxylase] ligase [Bacteroidota bacterium]
MSISESSGKLTSEAIASGLQTQRFGRTAFILDTISSTNEYARTLDEERSIHGTLVTAEVQTSGHGRLGRPWDSPKSKNLLFSLLLKPEQDDIHKASLIPFAAALAAAEAIEAETSLSVECKWPNDLLIEKKKVCGMLLESSIIGTRIEKLVLGIGVNVNQEEFPVEILPQATSLLIEKGAPIDRIGLLQRMLVALEKRYDQLMSGPATHVLDAWKRKTTMFGTHVTVRESHRILTGVAESLADDGSLQLRLEDGSLYTVRAGDVTLGYQQTFLHH